MRKLPVTVIALLVAAALGPAAAAASGAVVANGGGIGTVNGTDPFSHFGFGVRFAEDGSARGHFTCLMAGNATFPSFEPLMKVDGDVTTGTADLADGAAEFTGAGTLNLGPSGRTNAVFRVRVTSGGAGVGTLRLTVLDPSFPLPTEHILSGRISVG
jgi:hypothetical protein